MEKCTWFLTLIRVLSFQETNLKLTHIFIVTLLPSTIIFLLRNAACIVGGCASENSFFIQRTTREVFPTRPSPRSTTLKLRELVVVVVVLVLVLFSFICQLYHSNELVFQFLKLKQSNSDNTKRIKQMRRRLIYRCQTREKTFQYY